MTTYTEEELHHARLGVASFVASIEKFVNAIIAVPLAKDSSDGGLIEYIQLSRVRDELIDEILQVGISQRESM